MADAVGGSTRDESGRQKREEEADESRDNVEAEEVTRLRLLVQQGSGLDKQEELLEASRVGRLEVVRFLVDECDADVNIQRNDGWTTLMSASREGRLEVVRFLVDECDADVTIQEKNGWTALMEAAYGGHVNVVRFLVNEGGADVNMQDNYERTALMRAARWGHTGVVMFLVNEGGADVNVQQEDGRTALMEAAYGGHMDVVRFLVNEGGVNVNMQDNYERTALMRAADAGHTDVVMFLVNEGGADVNVQQKDGKTALMEAAYGGHMDVVRFLVNEGSADVNMQDNYERTALMRAADAGHTDVMMFLVNEGSAGMNVQQEDGWTTLMEASRGGHIDGVRKVVEEIGADVNIQLKNGWTALMLAADGGHVDVVKFLVNEGGADVNIQQKDASTSLMWGSRGGHTDVVRILVNEGGADVNIQDNYGRTALMEAARGGHTDVVRILVNEGNADVNLKNSEAHTAIRIASDYGYTDIVRLLTPFAQPAQRSTTHTGVKLLASDAYRSIQIPPSEVELCEFDEQGNTGGDFRVKWLGADAVVKLFIPDASGSTFEQEVRAWQELRHPNVLKLYGVCQAAPNVNFFVCEYASQGSLAEYTMSSSSASHNLKPRTAKFLYEAALGLEYLHERGIIHSDLRCSNILIGNDEMAKLSNFGSTGVANRPRSVIRSMRWQSPEVLEGNPPSRESDVYSLGMCILEAESGKRPWFTEDESIARFYKLTWNAGTYASVPYDEDDEYNPCGGDVFVRNADPYFVRRSRKLVWRMCRHNPHGRPSLTSIITELEHLSVEGRPDVPQPEFETVSCFEGCKGGEIKERWHTLEKYINGSGNIGHCQLLTKLKHICARLRATEQSQRLVDRFYSLVTDFYRTVKMTPEEAWAMQLSSTRATTTSMISFTRRVDTLLKALGESVSEETEISWQQQRHDQGAAFVSGITDTVLLLQRLKSVEEQSALLNSLRSEMEKPDDKYSDEQLRTMKKTYDAIESKLATEGVENAATLTPEWFIPWYELILDEGGILGSGGFGSVRRAKWLDSDVVVKEVLLAGAVVVPAAMTVCLQRLTRDRQILRLLPSEQRIKQCSAGKPTFGSGLATRTWFGSSVLVTLGDPSSSANTPPTAHWSVT